MKISKRRQRTAKKLVLPLIAIVMMTTMMYLDAANRPGPAASRPAAPAAARVSHGMHQR